VSLPAYALTTRRSTAADRTYSWQVWDPLRHKWVALTPEEEVRQRLIQLLLQEKHYPRSLLAAERSLQYAQLQKRFDLLGFDRQARPLLLAECKAPDVRLEEATLEQIALYNSRFGAPWLLVTNGKLMLVFHLSGGQYQFRGAELAAFSELLKAAG
jgi:hypothetical protein